MSAPAEFAGPSPPSPDGGSRWFRQSPAAVLSVLGVWLLFGLYASVRSPVPGVNEPHYLAKTRHVWDPDWCRGDLFLESANPHAVFYWLFGPLTSILPLEGVALVGRLLVWLCLAWAWCRLFHAVRDWEGEALAVREGEEPRPPDSLQAIPAAGLYLGLCGLGSFAGEWIVGGVESKGFAWAAIWMALACVLEGRPYRAAIFAGLGTSLHPVVGVWGTLACLGASLAMPALSERGSRGWRHLAQCCALWLVTSLPGLIPALQTISTGSPQLAAEASRIQVEVRLAHHLDSRTFSAFSWLLVGVELLAFVVLRGSACLLARSVRRESPGSSRRSFTPFDAAMIVALLVAVAGVAIGFGPRWHGAMKFYPFRLLDGLLPVAIAMALVGVFALIPHGRRISGVVGAVLFVTALLIPNVDRNPSRMPPEELRDWVAACRWIAVSTPRTATVVTPSYSFAFKWYAERPEYVSNKDIPQDARGILTWQDRRKRLALWRSEAVPLEYPKSSLSQLRRLTGATYLLASRDVVQGILPVYRNDHFEVFRLPD